MKDPQYLHHVLTTVVGPKLFYDLPLLTSRFMRKIALHKECMVTRNKAKDGEGVNMSQPTDIQEWFVAHCQGDCGKGWGRSVERYVNTLSPIVMELKNVPPRVLSSSTG